jgi:hypothetical protein
MPKYKVTIPFYKLSEAKNYNVDDEIELSKEEAHFFLIDKKVVEIKEKTSKK